MSGSADSLGCGGEHRRQLRAPAAPLRCGQVLVQLHVHAGLQRYVLRSKLNMVVKTKKTVLNVHHAVPQLQARTSTTATETAARP